MVSDIASSAGNSELDALPDNDSIILSTAVFHGMDFFSDWQQQGLQPPLP